MDLTLQLQQKQVLSQKMQQSAEILQMNVLSLSEYIHTAAQENPLLDVQEPHAPVLQEDTTLERFQFLRNSDEQNRFLYQQEQDTEQERENAIFGSNPPESLREFLHAQIRMLSCSKKEQQILHFFAENTDERGYLYETAIQECMNCYDMNANEIEPFLHQFQCLEPCGVGARTIAECLMLQLKQKNGSPLSFTLVEQALDDVAKNRISYLAKKFHVTVAVLTQALEEIKQCTPKPGSGFAPQSPISYIVPDAFVWLEQGEIQVNINHNAVPQLFINHSYLNLLHQDNSQQTKEYIVQKLRQAQWAVECVQKREQTLLATTIAVSKHQRIFFESPDGALRPLRMADIAKQLQVHESTISRAVKEKYIQCARGIFPLSFFFSKTMQSDTESISANHIQKRIATLIANENKKNPLSDRVLTEQLIAEGIQISRRTVAKYREHMGIGGAAARKQY